MITATKRYIDIPFAHRQPEHPGHCQKIHGHNWGIELTFGASRLDKCGFVMDFGDLKEIKEWIAQNLDHRILLNISDPILESIEPAPLGMPSFLQDLEKVADITEVEDCSCEGLARTFHEIFDQIVSEKTGGRVHILRVKVEEDSKNSATYEPPIPNFTPL